MDHVLSKQSFAEFIGVTPARLSQYLAEGRISGEAVVGVGRHARINVAVAQAQLKTRLDITQRIANGRARLDGAGAAAVEDGIKAERLAQLRHLNQRAAEEAALRAGAYVKAADARQQFGNIAARLMSTFEASFVLIANAIVASRAQTPRDILRAMRSTWREVRTQTAKTQGAEAFALPPMIDGDADAARES
jgi:predicted transcriptional regulator